MVEPSSEHFPPSKYHGCIPKGKSVMFVYAIKGRLQKGIMGLIPSYGGLFLMEMKLRN